jgi:hypothetical protein
MQDSNAEHGTIDFVVDQLEELIVTIIEEIRDRPAVALAIVAGVVGIVVGSMVAASRRRSARPAQRVARRARGVSDAAALAGLTMRLLQNPIVRAYLLAMIQGRLRRRFSR